MSILYVADQRIESHQETHQALTGVLQTLGAEVVYPGTELATVDAVVAELTHSNPELEQLVLDVHELGKRALILTHRLGPSHLPEPLRHFSNFASEDGSGVTYINYSALFIAKSAVATFYFAYFKQGQPFKVDHLSNTEVGHITETEEWALRSDEDEITDPVAYDANEDADRDAQGELPLET